MHNGNNYEFSGYFSQVKIAEMQFGFVEDNSTSDTTETIFIVLQMHDKFSARARHLYFWIVDLRECIWYQFWEQ